MRAELHGGTGDGLTLTIRGDVDYRPGRPSLYVAWIAVFTCHVTDPDGAALGTWHVPVEYPQWPDEQILNAAAGLWRLYAAPGIPHELDDLVGFDWTGQ